MRAARLLGTTALALALSVASRPAAADATPRPRVASAFERVYPPSVPSAEDLWQRVGGVGLAIADEPAPLAYAPSFVIPPELDVSIGSARGGDKPRAKPARAPKHPRRRGSPLALTAERAQLLLRSLTMPGWGQATLGHRTAGTVFAVAEAGVWGSFTAFRIQEKLRRDSAARTARIYAGVNLQGRDEEFLRLVGAFISSDEYNQLVVSRDAANLYYEDPVRYRAYIAAHSLSGNNAWSWSDEASFARYQGQRKNAQRAGLRANTALALAIVNRLMSVVHVARAAGRAADHPAATHSWNFEVGPAGGDDPTAFRCGVRASF